MSQSLLKKSSLVEIYPLGAGREVGRSCIIFRYLGNTIMLDCGLHPAKSGFDALPILIGDDLNKTVQEVNVMLISHFHHDHCAALPYIVGMTKFNGRILMTRPTKAIYHHVLKDHILLSERHECKPLYNIADLEKSMKMIETIDFHQTLQIGNSKITALMAGHVLGAAMFQIEIDGLSLLYTGDYSRDRDRHMPVAEVPINLPQLVIIESTYGITNHHPRLEREAKFLEIILNCLLVQKGKVLLPTTSLGRAQELLLMLEQHWERNPHLHHIPVYQISSIAAHTIPIYKTYVDMMNEDIKREFQYRNPFQFKHIFIRSQLSKLDHLSWPCVVLASPSTMTAGTTRDLFDKWCDDNRNSLILTDFAVQGTIARQLVSNPRTISSKEGKPIKVRLTVDAISFSAHADFKQTSEYIDLLRLSYVILVHGEKREIDKLSKELSYRATLGKVERYIYSPRTGQSIKLYYKTSKINRTVDRLSEKYLYEGISVQGSLFHQRTNSILTNIFNVELIKPLTNSSLRNSQLLPLVNYESYINLQFSFGCIFDKNITEFSLISPFRKTERHSIITNKIVCLVYVYKSKNCNYLKLEWDNCRMGEIISSTTIALILQKNQRNLKMASSNDGFKSKIDDLKKYLMKNFGLGVNINKYKNISCIRSDGEIIQLRHRYSEINGPEKLDLAKHINEIVDLIDTSKKLS